MTATPVIAIVDDDASVRHAMGRLVRSFDLDVELFSSGPELLQSASIDHIACLITDIQMPAMNGFALCEALRARGYDMPVVFMTAFAQEGYEQRARDAGASCFLNKPFQDTDIIRCIENALLPRLRPPTA
ncbi:response regulator transcription factor [Cupriavidus plantarum]|uniref:Response regulator receiver domain-containing protein n=1 Tax=Cupriavidus plantarum TaxID=942865 RepID=A0A316EWW1_9BURK|nr:response regulator [Cupriavidus plantarum]NYI01249.1 FixJ family two-component response regulator [Cupriavidus plantarum]PWK35639.1 response regulator receiver domain-containing protein [Cupriavidus plantarum]REE94101.1 response regulator receiver domain-containing protein [Cupriavidus plantarum]RLK39515.1 response regulator receiver domain-containing protein [Cupriavidus plantarum]CAG2133371.1 Transcriptional regulatory protein TdiR [Cupriavidus plantarum]